MEIYVNSFIDTVQNGKKLFVNTYVTNESLKTELNLFVDKQTDFVKQIVRTWTAIYKS
jgi:hypothetical protein